MTFLRGRNSRKGAVPGFRAPGARPRILFVGSHPRSDFGSRSISESLAGRLEQRGFSFYLTSRRRSRNLRVVEMLLTVCLARKTYDVGHIDLYSGSAFRWGEWVARLLKAFGKPFVVTLHGGNLPVFAQSNPGRVGRLLSTASAVVAPSPYLAKAMFAARADIKVIPNPLDVETYAYAERKNPRPKLIWLRTFHRIYDPVLAVRVLAHVVSETNDAHLTMIGADKDGSLADVRREAERLGVLDRILFTGGVPKAEVPRLLAAADIFLNTTTIDNTPVSVLEAMATGLLVVSTSVGGIPYLVENVHDGILVPAGDAFGMAEAVKRLLNEPQLAARLSRNARAKAEAFGWDAILPCWESLFVDVAAHNSV